MLADGRLSAQAVLGEYHLLSWATISVPLLPIWFWSVIWKHLAFVFLLWVLFRLSCLALFLLHICDSVSPAASLLIIALCGLGVLHPQQWLQPWHSPVLFRTPVPHSTPSVEQCSFEIFQLFIGCTSLKHFYIPSQAICLSNLRKWSTWRVDSRKSWCMNAKKLRFYFWNVKI